MRFVRPFIPFVVLFVLAATLAGLTAVAGELLLEWLAVVAKWVLLVFLIVMPIASLLTWAERRQSAMMQDRLGPNRAAPTFAPWLKLKGILHFVADAIKMISKEDFIPGNVHKGLFTLAPLLAIGPVLIAFAIIPFGPTIYPHVLDGTLDPLLLASQPEHQDFLHSIRLQVASFDYGILFYFAIDRKSVV